MSAIDTGTRFQFGENWLKFSSSLTDSQVAEAERSLVGLLGRSDLTGLSFLDVGCGSGLFSLAARRLGASVRSFDIDLDSVRCTEALRQHHRPDDPDWTVEPGSILDRSFTARLGTFDIVYAWGSLHHTGALADAIASAMALVAGGGTIVLALYRRTRMCWFWRMEKKWYCEAGPRAQQLARSLYVFLFRIACTLTGRNFRAYVATYHARSRGMNFQENVADWLGGYPYESMSPEMVRALVPGSDFAETLARTRGPSLGLFGSGCDEYVYRRIR